MVLGINGFGRVGRLTLRIAIDRGIPVAAINDPNIPLDYMVYMFRYDSTHTGYNRRSDITVGATEDGKLDVCGRIIEVFGEREAKDIPWGRTGERLGQKIRDEGNILVFGSSIGVAKSLHNGTHAYQRRSNLQKSIFFWFTPSDIFGEKFVLQLSWHF